MHPNDLRPPKNMGLWVDYNNVFLNPLRPAPGQALHSSRPRRPVGGRATRWTPWLVCGEVIVVAPRRLETLRSAHACGRLGKRFRSGRGSHAAHCRQAASEGRAPARPRPEATSAPRRRGSGARQRASSPRWSEVPRSGRGAGHWRTDGIAPATAARDEKMPAHAIHGETARRARASRRPERLSSQAAGRPARATSGPRSRLRPFAHGGRKSSGSTCSTRKPRARQTARRSRAREKRYSVNASGRPRRRAQPGRSAAAPRWVTRRRKRLL